MAVEAQFDYSMPSQPGGAAGNFLDHPHLVFNNTPTVNNSNNPRKRGREIYATPPPPPKNLRISSPNMQHHQLIDLSQLHSPPPNTVVSTGLGLSFGGQQNQSAVSMLQQDVTTQIQHQTDEIDQFLLAQLHEMRRKIAEMRQTHYRALLKTAEEAVAKRMREKDLEIEKAFHRNSELQARAAHFSAEAQVWKARAKAQEATAAALQAQLQNAMMSRGCAQTQNVGLTCVSGEGSAGDAESAYIDPERVEVRSVPSCKACQKRVASVVVLPCRHLCLCRECDGVVSTCPICLSFKSSSLEVSLR
ncbi:BOI-related E3 ubiquitin-protein ligase 1-like [Apium graveolens]|uniref:BOI-related E3 ubiquitin-protein ligase 1-like n=1 Tax=Apium graveolens TaxID=4045 RepID=UPI003D78D3E6